jgi:hypothetical protein
LGRRDLPDLQNIFIRCLTRAPARTIYPSHPGDFARVAVVGVVGVVCRSAGNHRTVGMRRTPFPRLARLIANLIAGAIAALLARPAMAGNVQFQLGEQDFADGKTPVFSSEIRAAGAGEAYPFDGTLFGNDTVRGALGAFDFTHTFNLNGARPISAKLTIGLIDVDSTTQYPLDTVGVMFEGVSQPAEMLRGISAPGAKSSAEVVEIPVPLEYLSSTGTLHVSVVAHRAGYGNLGNAIEPDFSRLTIETAAESNRPPTDGGGIDGNGGGDNNLPDPPTPPTPPDPVPQAVPLPPVLAPAGLVVLALATAPKRRVRRWLRIWCA